ncbi:MAG: HNH endonuclease, partial [Myxococcota bacterium]
SGRLRVPRLVLLADYNRVPRTPLRLSRRNVFLRDEQTCQYCGSRSDLTLDHVLPRSRGGASSWENLVACCRECNLSKGQRTPDEAKMNLQRKPVRPTWTVVVQLTGVDDPLPDWEPFLGAAARVRKSA